MGTSWQSQMHPVKDGEDVKAVVANRLPGELERRTDYLKERMDFLAAGEALVDTGAALAPEVQTGHAVYWDATNKQYAPAKVAVRYDQSAGGYVVDSSSYAVGLCLHKLTATTGDIVVSGLIRNFDFTNGIGSKGDTPAESGAYYLSASTPGKYSLQKNPVSIYILLLRGDGAAIINPTPREVLEAHVHYAFDLFAQPAGTLQCTLPGEPYAFDLVDPLTPGWLPADSAVFANTAPAGAKYGYNLTQHPQLSRVWPPVPVSSTYLEMDGLGVDPALFSIDANGLWWYDNCYSKAPWPTEGHCQGSSSSASATSSDSGVSCPTGSQLEQMGFLHTDPNNRRLRVYFTKMVFKTNTAAVTSLQAVPDAPVKILGCSTGTPVTTGDLKVDVDLTMLAVQEDVEGYEVLKGVNAHQLLRGPVLSGLKAGGNIVITPLTGAGEVDADGYVRGKATIAAQIPTGDQQEGQIALVALDGVREELYSGVFYLSFPKGRDSSIRGRLLVPNFNSATASLQLTTWLLGRKAGQLPNLSFSTKLLPTPLGCTARNLDQQSESALATIPGCLLGTDNDYIVQELPGVIVAPGQQLYFTLKRTGSVDTYPGDVGILKLGFNLVSI